MLPSLQKMNESVSHGLDLDKVQVSALEVFFREEPLVALGQKGLERNPHPHEAAPARDSS